MGTETKKVWESKAPTRIDLAGGTVDLWPLHLFLDRPLTINLGINLFAEARLEVSAGASRTDSQKTLGIVLRSEDQGHELAFRWGDDVTPPPALSLHFKFLRHFLDERVRQGKPEVPAGARALRLSTRAKSPAGAGLGGSSTLSVAIIGTLAAWAREKAVDPLKDGPSLIEAVRDIETTVIQVPAGVQDYYGAMFGGLQALRWGVGTHSREYYPEAALREIESRVLLFYSGQSRNSGINNWDLYKRFIDRDPAIRARFDGIHAATRSLDQALAASDWAGATRAVAAEWESRRGLSAGISTPEIDRAFAAARAAGSDAGKICGAGGGGCFFVMTPPERRAAVESAVIQAGSGEIRALPFRAVSRGLEVTLREE